MDINELYKQYTSDEQKRDYDLLVQLSDAVNAKIILNRRKTVDILLSEYLTEKEKKDILKANIQTRVNFQNQDLLLAGSLYKYSDVISLARKLYNDTTFVGSESEYVLNGIMFQKNSITFEDCLIAFHYYRMSQGKESFDWLVSLLCQNIYYSLSREINCEEFIFNEGQSGDYLRKLVKYVHGYWKDNSENIPKKDMFLRNDIKVDFYQKIDDDAQLFFAVNDLEQEGKIEESKHLKSEDASKRISQCANSLYLLFSTVKEINNNGITKDCFSNEVKMLRKDIVDICDQLYNGESDAFGVLEGNILLDSAKMNSFERENENKLLKLILKTALDKLNGLGTKEVLECRQESLRTEALLESKELIDEFTREFSKKLMCSIPNNLETYYKRIKQEIGNKYELLPQEALHELASAEYLFDLFVRNKAPDDFDYSGIAILYFQAFETAYDELVVSAYSKWLKERHVDELIITVAYPSQEDKDNNKLKSYKRNVATFFNTDFNIKSFCRKNGREKDLVSFLEIGTFRYFIDVRGCLDAKEGEPGCQLVYYLQNICFKKPINLELLESFLDALNNAIEPRNKAAHGLTKIQKNEVIEDKTMVYDGNDIKNILDYKNLLYAFLEFFR